MVEGLINHIYGNGIIKLNYKKSDEIILKNDKEFKLKKVEVINKND